MMNTEKTESWKDDRFILVTKLSWLPLLVSVTGCHSTSCRCHLCHHVESSEDLFL